jgi:hypothetical protein
MLCVDRPCGKKTTGLDGRRAERVSNDQKERLGSQLGSLNLDLADCLVIRAILNVEIQTLEGTRGGGGEDGRESIGGGGALAVGSAGDRTETDVKICKKVARKQATRELSFERELERVC